MSVIDFASACARRATGQPLTERSTVFPLHQPGRTIPIRAVQPQQPGIIGMKARIPDGRVGTFTTAVDCRLLEFVGDGGPECA